MKGREEFEGAVPLMDSLASFVPPATAVVEVILVGERRMAQLNRRYRGMRGAVEILTFSYTGGEASIRCGTEDPAGEIYLCWKRLVQGAGRREVSRVTYLLRLLAHGLYHLKGFGHDDPGSENVMEEVERELLGRLIAPRELSRLFA